MRSQLKHMAERQATAPRVSRPGRDYGYLVWNLGSQSVVRDERTRRALVCPGQP